MTIARNKFIGLFLLALVVAVTFVLATSAGGATTASVGDTVSYTAGGGDQTGVVLVVINDKALVSRDGSNSSQYFLPLSSITVTSTPTPTPTSTPTPSPTATSTPTSTPTPSPTVTPGAFPNQSNTGAIGHTPSASCTTSPASGAVLSDCLYSGGATITTSGAGATYRFSEFRGQVTHNGAGTLTIESSNFGPASGCQTYDNSITGGNYTVRGSRFNTHVSEGPRVADSNIDIEDNLIGPMCSNPGDHSDGVQGYFGGTNIKIIHNTIDQRTAADVTSPIFFADSSQSADVENNLVAGGGYSLRLQDDFTPDHGPWLLIGNRIVDGAWDFGPMDNVGTSFTAQTCSDNRLVNIDSSYNVTSTGALVDC